jgi:hypothetical protein
VWYLTVRAGAEYTKQSKLDQFWKSAMETEQTRKKSDFAALTLKFVRLYDMSILLLLNLGLEISNFKNQLGTRKAIANLVFSSPSRTDTTGLDS